MKRYWPPVLVAQATCSELLSTPPAHLFRANFSVTTDESSEIADSHDRHVVGIGHFVADSAAN